MPHTFLNPNETRRAKRFATGLAYQSSFVSTEDLDTISQGFAHIAREARARVGFSMLRSEEALSAALLVLEQVATRSTDASSRALAQGAAEELRATLPAHILDASPHPSLKG